MATLKQIQAKLKKLQAQAEHLIAQRAQAVLDDIRAMMERHGLTTADIDRHGKKTKAAAKPRVALPAPAGRHEAMTKLAKKGKLPAKYRNPKTGETWSGWARPPAWIANVKDRSKFLIDGEGSETPGKPKAAAKKAPAKKSSSVAAKKGKTSPTGVSAAKKKVAAPAAKKSVAAKPAVKAAKRSAPRKKAVEAAASSTPTPVPEQANASASEAPTPPTSNGASA